MATEPQPMAVINRLFGRLQGIYGNSFTGKFSTGFNAATQRDDGWENAKLVWAEDLAGFDLDDIAYALRYVDPDRAPSSRQIVELCRKAPRKQTSLALPKPSPGDHERALAAINEAAKAITGGEEYDPLLWAKRPKSQKAMDYVIDGARRSEKLRLILETLKVEGVVDAAGKLLKRYKAVLRPASC